MIANNIRVRTSVVCLESNRILAFKAIDPTSQKHYLFLPGGKIEEGESAEQAAIRETREETGYEVDLIDGWMQLKNYLFDWDGAAHNCSTYFYIGRLKDKNELPHAVNDAAYNKGVCWVPVDEAEHAFSYHPVIQLAVMQALRHAGVCK